MDCRQPSPLRFASPMPNPQAEDGWYKRRSYLHFDLPLSYDSAHELVRNPQKVAKHSFYPLVRFVISTKKLIRDGLPERFDHKPKERDIRYASHADAHIYSFYAEQLLGKYENFLCHENFQESVLAFRRLNKSNIHFAKDAFQAIKEAGDVDVVGIDIKDFFGSLDHEILKARWKELLQKSELPQDHYAVYRSITKYSWVDRDKVYRLFKISTHNPKHGRQRICDVKDFREIVRRSKIIERNESKKGVPQGTPISALLSNIYMIELDRQFSTMATELGGKYFRYCDDILLIVGADKGEDALKKATEFLLSHNLQIQPTKTEFRKFRISEGQQKSAKPLQYLGFLFDGQKILLRSAALARYSEKMGSAVRLAKLTLLSRNLKRLERGENERPLGRGKLYRKYAYLGRRNFVSYAHRAAGILESRAIKKQVRPLWRRLKESIDK